jgi:small conductance mechanosensitive channel
MLLDLTWGDVGEWFVAVGIGVIIVALVTFILVKLINTIVPRLLRPALERQMVGRPEAQVTRRSDTLANVIVRTLQGILIAIAVITILPAFGIDVSALLASVGIASIAIGLGAQTLVRDWLNGMFILSEDHYSQGDVVTIAGVTGTVEYMSIRRTVLRDVNGVVHSVPHGSVTVTSNETRDYSRVRLNLPVHVTSDLEKVREVVDRVGRELASDPEFAPKVVTPPAFLRIDGIDANGIAVHISGTVRPGTQLEIAGVLRTRLLETMQREGLKTPWG